MPKVPSGSGNHPRQTTKDAEEAHSLSLSLFQTDTISRYLKVKKSLPLCSRRALPHSSLARRVGSSECISSRISRSRSSFINPARHTQDISQSTPKHPSTMPALESEISGAVLISLAAGALLLAGPTAAVVGGPPTSVGTVLLTHIIAHATVPGLAALSKSLALTESYPRLRVPPLRYYWAGAFHVVGTVALTSAVNIWILAVLLRSGAVVGLLGAHDLAIQKATAIMYVLGIVVVLITGYSVYAAECEPETKPVVQKDQAGRLVANFPGGYVPRGHWFTAYSGQRIWNFFFGRATLPATVDETWISPALQTTTDSCEARYTTLEELNMAPDSSDVKWFRLRFEILCIVEILLHAIFLRQIMHLPQEAFGPPAVIEVHTEILSQA